MSKIFVPPIKCQGIKTKIVPLILENAELSKNNTWFEPFMGSGVVGFNKRAIKAIFGDINPHIINFYNAVKSSKITPEIAKDYLNKEGCELHKKGEEHYYIIRERFNSTFNPLDFLFLSRSCFNGMIRFNKNGKFNVPFCRKTNRYSQAYVTKIINQINYVWQATQHFKWNFECLPFEETINQASEGDMIYCDPPYLGRHVDYFDSWSESDEWKLYESLANTKAKFILSTWHSNKYRNNIALETIWSEFYIITKEHFYHVGARENNRNSMLEALVMNFKPTCERVYSKKLLQPSLFNS